MKPPNRALMIVSISVFLGSSTWFSGTAATPVLRKLWTLNDFQCAWLTVSVQLGFIVGTILFALFNLSDLFNTRKVFFFSALMGAIFNALFAGISQGLGMAVLFRFLTGLTLAGVYPVGMKIIAQWFHTGLGLRLSVLVGALTLGTACPYLIFAFGADFNWRYLMYLASFFSLLGGLIVLLSMSDGPNLKDAPRFDIKMVFKIFTYRKFRLQAFGYFGHMWELYAFWSLVGLYISASFAGQVSFPEKNLYLISFLAIAIGAFGCILGGWISRISGEKAAALISLLVSGSFCLFSGILYELPAWALVPLILVWGMFVIADSPQFSALAVNYCPPQYVGTALTIQNGLGFGITVVSIQLIAWLAGYVGWNIAFMFLAIGPLAGIISIFRLKPFTSDHCKRTLSI